MIYRLAFVVSFVFLIGCSHTDSTDKDLAVTMLTQRHYKDIYFSTQPELADFAALKAQGFTHVVNLRHSSEYDEAKERETVKGLGMIYSNVPFQNPVTDEFVGAVTKKVKAYRKTGKTLIHCSSGNRAATWAGAHFFKDHKYSKEKAFAKAKELGLNKAKAEKMLNGYLATK